MAKAVMAKIKADILKGAELVQEPINHPVAPVPVEVDIVPDGDFAGLSTAEVVRALTDGIHDALGRGDADLIVAGCAFDMALGEYLAMVDHMMGKQNAKVAALAFCQTALPYATADVPIVVSYAEARQINAAMKKGDDDA